MNSQLSNSSKYSFVAEFDDDDENIENFLSTSLSPLIKSLLSPLRKGDDMTLCILDSKPEDEEVLTVPVQPAKSQCRLESDIKDSTIDGTEMDVVDAPSAKNRILDHERILMKTNSNAIDSLDLDVEEVHDEDQDYSEEGEYTELSPIIPSSASYLADQELLFQKLRNVQQERQDYKFAILVSQGIDPSVPRYSLRRSSSSIVKGKVKKVLGKPKKKSK